MARRRTEIIVGIVTILAFFLLILVTVNLKKTLLFGKRYEINVYFKSIKGLAVGAPVHVYGMEAGEVRRIEYVKGEYPIKVVLAIRKGIKLFKNAKIRIATTGLIGETSVEIDAGTPEAGEMLASYAVIGIEALDLYQVLSLTPDIVENISASLTSFREIITDEENKRALSNSIKRLDSITLQLDKILGESGQDIKQVLSNLNDLSADTRVLLDRIDSLLVRTDSSLTSAGVSINQALNNLNVQINELSQQMEIVLKRVEDSAVSFNTFLSDNSEDIREAGANLKSSMAKLNTILERIERGEGTLSLLINDPAPFYELRDIIHGLRGLLYNIPESQFDTSIPYEQQ